MQDPSEKKKHSTPSFGLSLSVFTICAFTIGFSVLFYSVDAHIPMILSTVICSVTGVFVLRRPWEDVQKGIENGIKTALLPIVILMTIGLMVASWIACGTVPTLIYYGLQVLSPKFFLLAGFFLCAVVALATGSSWTTAGTVGLALMGIGGALGVPAAMTAGAVVSGAYFGDKMSPLSDTTNLAPAVAGGELFDHIRAMMWTTFPAAIIAAVIYTVLGLKFGGDITSAGDIQVILTTLSENYSIGLLAMIPPFFIIVASARKMSALPALIISVFLAGIIAYLNQGVGFKDFISIVHYGYESETGVKMVDDLLSRGGLDKMMWTVSLIVCALSFGGIMERCGFLKSILHGLVGLISKPSSLVGTTLVSGVLANVFLGDQFLGIILPGRTFKPAYDEMGLAPRMLSRTLEDSGTLSSALIPWTACGAYMFGVLGVSPFAYAPYAFVNWTCPIIAWVMTLMGIGIFWKEKTTASVIAAEESTTTEELIAMKN